MMGQLNGGTAKLFYKFSLEEMVPQNHLLRKIDQFLNFDDLRALSAVSIVRVIWRYVQKSCLRFGRKPYFKDFTVKLISMRAKAP